MAIISCFSFELDVLDWEPQSEWSYHKKLINCSMKQKCFALCQRFIFNQILACFNQMFQLSLGEYIFMLPIYIHWQHVSHEVHVCNSWLVWMLVYQHSSTSDRYWWAWFHLHRLELRSSNRVAPSLHISIEALILRRMSSASFTCSWSTDP